MKKKISMLLAASMTSALLTGAFAAEITYDTGITVTVDGKNVKFDQQPVIADDRTLVPVRAIFEALGAEVEWIGETRTVISARGDQSCELVIDSTEMKVGDNTVTLDVPAMIINDRTLVPVRAISEAYGCEVEWIAETKTVVIASTTATAVPEATPVPTAAPAPTATPKPTATPTPAPITTAFADKKICVFGDDSVGNGWTWTNSVKLSLAPEAFISTNNGRRFMIVSSGDDIFANNIIEKIPTDADYILVQAGLAEWAYNRWGYNERNEMNSLEEGLDNVYFNLRRHAPEAEIIFITFPYMTIRSDYMDAKGVYNRNGLSPLEMSEVTRSFAKSIGCEVIDVYNECGWGEDNYKDYMKNTNDNYIYPSSEGCKVIAELVTKKLMKMNPEETVNE